MIKTSIFPLLFVAGCAQAPVQELELVRSRIEEVKLVEGPVYAPELLAESEVALAKAYRLTIEDKAYRGSIRVAARARGKADEAYIKSTNEKQLVARHVARLLGDLEVLLDIARSRGADREARKELLEFEAYRKRIVDLANTGDLLTALAEGESFKPELVRFEMRFRNSSPSPQPLHHP